MASKTTKTTTTVVHERREYRAYCGCCDWFWLVATIEGWLKLLQWISTFLTFVIIMAKIDRPIEFYSHLPEYNFMIFVGITSWAFVTVHIMLKLPHLFERLPAILLHPIVGVACCLLGALSFLIASSVVLAYARRQDFLKASAACGYIAMFLFIFEALYIFCRGRRSAASSETTATSRTVERVERSEPKEMVQIPEETKEREIVTHEFPN